MTRKAVASGERASPVLEGPSAPAPTRPSRIVRRWAFIGREEALASLHARLEEAPLVTIAGPPGVGKTRLAQQFLVECADVGASSVFCLLASAATVESALAIVGRELGLSLTSASTTDALIEHVARALAARGPMLLVLDNMEQLLPAATLAI